MTLAPTSLRDRQMPLRHWPALIVAIVLVTTGVVLLVEHTVFQGSSNKTSATQGSGVQAAQARQVAAFTSIELAGSNNVTVQVGATQSVVVHADDNLLGRVTTQVHGGRLVIGNTPGSFSTRSPMEVAITVPSLTELTVSGSGNISASGVKSSSFTVALRGSGLLHVSGTTTRLDVSLDGSGNAQLEQLIARDVRAAVNGSGEIFVTATGSFDGSVPGSGTIVYGGNPAHVTTSVTGSGAITRG